jgi:hypothetical protein
MGDCLLWTVFGEVTEVAHIFVLRFSLAYVYYRLILPKMGLAIHILGDFFTNSSGRPARHNFQKFELSLN